MQRLIIFLLLLCAPCFALAQTTKPVKHKSAKKHVVAKPVEDNPLEILGIRPGISFDSVSGIMKDAAEKMREVREDTLSHSYADQNVHVYVVDSIICRLTYMRMTFLFDGSKRLRRLTMIPRESSIDVGGSDDIENVLLLYFGQKWGKPELNLDPPLPSFRWKTGNIQLRGFIRRGYPMWVLEG